jgi:hypothetical protein
MYLINNKAVSSLLIGLLLVCGVGLVSAASPPHVVELEVERRNANNSWFNSSTDTVGFNLITLGTANYSVDDGVYNCSLMVGGANSTADTNSTGFNFSVPTNVTTYFDWPYSTTCNETSVEIDVTCNATGNGSTPGNSGIFIRFDDVNPTITAYTGTRLSDRNTLFEYDYNDSSCGVTATASYAWDGAYTNNTMIGANTKDREGAADISNWTQGESPYTLLAWVNDSAGNVVAATSQTVTIVAADGAAGWWTIQQQKQQGQQPGAGPASIGGSSTVASVKEYLTRTLALGQYNIPYWAIALVLCYFVFVKKK